MFVREVIEQYSGTPEGNRRIPPPVPPHNPAAEQRVLSIIEQVCAWCVGVSGWCVRVCWFRYFFQRQQSAANLTPQRQQPMALPQLQQEQQQPQQFNAPPPPPPPRPTVVTPPTVTVTSTTSYSEVSTGVSSPAPPPLPVPTSGRAALLEEIHRGKQLHHVERSTSKDFSYDDSQGLYSSTSFFPLLHFSLLLCSPSLVLSFISPFDALLQAAPPPTTLSSPMF